MPLTADQQQALDKIAPACILCEQEFGIPSAVTAGQWALETGWGRHMPPNSNNPFGIKQYPGCAGRVLAGTREYFNPAELHQFLARGDGRKAAIDSVTPAQNGKPCYVVMDWFATFPAIADAFRYRAKLLITSPLYSSAVKHYRQDQNAEAFIDAIAKKYSTSEDYAETLKNIAFGAVVTKTLEEARHGD